MTAVVEVSNLSKRFGQFTAIDGANFSIEENTIHGLLGRNGAGKTTLMQLITGQDFASAGSISLFGENPVENSKALANVCFVKESQKYPDDFKPKHVLRSVADFRLPLNRRIKKLSRGQLSAIGVIVGLASRAPLTFFDEPYLGLDAVARQTFYDRLLEDYAEHPRTVVLSTHLIDEVSNLLEHVIVVDEGRIIIDSSSDDLRGSASTVAGARATVDAFVAGREVLHREQLGGLSSVTVRRLSEADRAAAVQAGLELAPVSLQQLIVRTTTSDTEWSQAS
jgi:ABC-2 type transport system ATP-binding protein